MFHYLTSVHINKLIVFISHRLHRLDSCCRDREDKPRRHRRLLLGGIVFHYHYDILLSEFGSARLNICTEMQHYVHVAQRPDLHGTAKSIHHSRRISQESSERMNLLCFGRSSPFFARGRKSSLLYSAPYMKARLEVYLVVRSGSGGRQTNSAAAPVCSHRDPPAKPILYK